MSTFFLCEKKVQGFAQEMCSVPCLDFLGKPYLCRRTILAHSRSVQFCCFEVQLHMLKRRTAIFSARLA